MSSGDPGLTKRFAPFTQSLMTGLRLDRRRRVDSDTFRVYAAYVIKCKKAELAALDARAVFDALVADGEPLVLGTTTSGLAVGVFAKTYVNARLLLADRCADRCADPGARETLAAIRADAARCGLGRLEAELASALDPEADAEAEADAGAMAAADAEADAEADADAMAAADAAPERCSVQA